MSPASGLYRTRVAHTRLRPFRHHLAYRVMYLLADLDELPGLARRLRLFSFNRAGVVSFFERDHGPRDGTPLRPWAEAHLAEAGIDLDGGPIRILCFPRTFGYVFNPISVWYCYDRRGLLRAVIHEVRNTFGDSHSYLVPVDPAESGFALRHHFPKRLHVSPFMDMEALYRFRVTEPGERVSVAIRQSDDDGELLTATLAGVREPISDSRLARMLVAYPFLTLKVIAAIHWQAVKLWRKGARYRSKPPAPSTPVTHVEPIRDLQ